MQVLRFIAVGGLNTVVGLACIYAAMWAGVDYRPANAIGYAVGCCVAYAGNRIWTFRHSGPIGRSAPRWLAVVAVCFALNLLVVVGLHKTLHIDPAVAQLGGILVYTATSFLGARYFAFGAGEPAGTTEA